METGVSREIGVAYYDHMMPAGCNKMIRSVSINYDDVITGFAFFDKDGALLWSI
jgi:hypothetical protein